MDSISDILQQELEELRTSGYDFWNDKKGELELLESNYLYLYHLDKYVILPTFPDNLQDSMSSKFGETNALSRTAPVLTYSNSGPRTVGVQLKLHRDVVNELNANNPTLTGDEEEQVPQIKYFDYVDKLIRYLQASVLPKYVQTTKSVVPPMIALRCGNEVFIKGVINGPLQVNYSKPILSNGKYAQVSIGFTVTEVDPYDAEQVAELGSFRGITRAFRTGW